MDPQTQIGPLANERRVRAVSHLVEDARTRGATVAAGGGRIGNHGFFHAPTCLVVTPTVLTDVPGDAEILRSEPFGPVAPILPFTHEAAMLEQANGLEFGLSAYVFTNDAVRQRRLKDALQFGSIGLNDVVTHPPEVPLGGWKESSCGTEGGAEILAPCQKAKFVSAR